MTDRGGWARGGMVVVALGVASNLVLTFVPDVVPDQVGPVVVYCMTAVIVLVAPLWAYRELIESSRRLQQERRRLRGIEAVGGERSREADVSALWRTATQRVLCFGVGLTSVSQDEEHIRETVGRGVDIDFVMVDPQWLRQQRKVAALAGDYYTESAFVARVEGAYDRLRGLAERYPEEAAGGTVRLHTPTAHGFSTARRSSNRGPRTRRGSSSSMCTGAGVRGSGWCSWASTAARATGRTSSRSSRRWTSCSATACLVRPPSPRDDAGRLCDDAPRVLGTHRADQ